MVHFTKHGRYNISTNIQNGFYFQDSSYITDTGYKKVILKARGKPILARTTNFLVAFDTSICTFSVRVVSVTAATYSLAGSPDACSHFGVQGNYTVGTNLTASNTVTLQVNVTSTGSYSITTTTNGMTFSGEGNFTSTGIQQVILKASGQPQVPGTNIIPVMAGNSTCNFTIKVGAANDSDTSEVNSHSSAWEFYQDNVFSHGYFDGALTHITNGSTVVTLVGLTPTKDTAIAILVNINGSPTVKTGTYKSSSSSTFSFFDTRGNCIYFADKTTPDAELTVTIAAYNAQTQIIEGTFSGTVMSQMNMQVAVTKGKFKAKLN